MFLFTLIGMIVICWILSRGFNKLGDFLNNIGDSIADWQTNSTIKTQGSNKNRNDTLEKIKTINGNGTDEEYLTKIRSEIEDLTK